MIPTSYSGFPSVPAVQTDCERVEAAGGVEGPDGKVSPVEGCVVRGHRKGGAPGEAFFWKVKYDEPYLMYREWRELTRRLLAAYPNLETVNPAKIRNDDSRLYLWWVAREIGRDVKAFDSWQHGKGIIKTREAFLSWSKTPEANVARRELGVKVAVSEEERRNRKFDKTLIVPVAIQGCGASLSLSPSPSSSATTRALTLSHVQARPLSASSSRTCSGGATSRATTSCRRSRRRTSCAPSRTTSASTTSSTPTSAHPLPAPLERLERAH